jgi:aminoglycoside phosphotransferase family enzyme
MIVGRPRMCALDISSEPGYALPNISEGSTPDVVPSHPPLSLITRYNITSRQASESAWIFFTSDPSTSKPLVMKVLRPYHDIRYDLSSETERQRCQLEAFQQNSVFTPEVYIGLARLHNQPSEEDHILIGDIIKQPAQAALEQNTDYALIMERLPDDRRFDQLLKGDEEVVQNYVDTLTCHIAHLHMHRTPSLTEESSYWGSYPQLQRKLEENLAFLALVLDKVNSPTMQATIEQLTTGLREIFTEEHYAHYLKQRVQAGSIKHCHGDIKSLNIWIMPDSVSADGQQQHLSVKLLDAIDFNPLFRNIDILSDFAMLVIDVWARTCSAALAHRMTDNYLQRTNQDDTSSRAIFEFYVVEKAIVAAAINILFDDQFELGLRLLDLAQEHLNHLVDNWLFQPA